jgi:hypothetical protein
LLAHPVRCDPLLAMTFMPIEIVVTGLDPVIHLLRKTFRED